MSFEIQLRLGGCFNENPEYVVRLAGFTEESLQEMTDLETVPMPTIRPLASDHDGREHRVYQNSSML